MCSSTSNTLYESNYEMNTYLHHIKHNNKQTKAGACWRFRARRCCMSTCAAAGRCGFRATRRKNVLTEADSRTLEHTKMTGSHAHATPRARTIPRRGLQRQPGKPTILRCKQARAETSKHRGLLGSHLLPRGQGPRPGRGADDARRPHPRPANP